MMSYHIAGRAIDADHLVHHGRPSSPDGDQTRLVHASCQRGLQARQRRDTGYSSTCNALAACLSRVPGTTRTHAS